MPETTPTPDPDPRALTKEQRVEAMAWRKECFRQSKAAAKKQKYALRQADRARQKAEKIERRHRTGASAPPDPSAVAGAEKERRTEAGEIKAATQAGLDVAFYDGIAEFCELLLGRGFGPPPAR